MKAEMYNQSHLRMWQRERCTEPLDMQFPPRDRTRPCQRKATWKLDGRLFCNIHAGFRALTYLEKLS